MTRWARPVVLATALCSGSCAPCAESSTPDGGRADGATEDAAAVRLACDAPECRSDLNCCTDEGGEYCCDYSGRRLDGGYQCNRGEPECTHGMYCCVVGSGLFGDHCVDYPRRFFCGTVGNACEGLSAARYEQCVAYWAERIPWWAIDGGVRPDGGSP